MDDIYYRKLLYKALGTLTRLYEAQFDEKYKMGEIDNPHERAYEDLRDEWVDRQIVLSTSMTYDELDAYMSNTL